MKIRIMKISSNDNILDVLNVNVGIDDHYIYPLDIHDPRNWGILDYITTRYILIEKWHVKELNWVMERLLKKNGSFTLTYIVFVVNYSWSLMFLFYYVLT